MHAHSYKLMLFVYVLMSAHFFPPVTMFDFGDISKWMTKIEKAKPLQFVSRVVNTVKKGDANQEDILVIVSEGVNLVDAFSSHETNSEVPPSRETPKPPVPVQPVTKNPAHTTPTNNGQSDKSNKVTVEIIRTDGGVQINDIFIPDSKLNIAGRFIPELQSVIPGKFQSSSHRPVVTSNSEKSDEHPTTYITPSVKMTPAPYFTSTTAVSPSSKSETVATSEERMRLEFTKTTGGFMFNDTIFIQNSHLELVGKLVPGFSTLFPNVSSNTSQPLKNSNQGKIILLVAKTADGVLINDTVVIHEDSLRFARDAVPWLNDLFPSNAGSEIEQPNKDHLKAMENSAVSKMHLLFNVQIFLAMVSLHVICVTL